MTGIKTALSSAAGASLIAFSLLSPQSANAATTSSDSTSVQASSAEQNAKFPGIRTWRPEHVSNMCITAHGGARKGAKVDQYTCVGQSNQRWFVGDVTGRPPVYRFQISSDSGLCLDIPRGNKKNGTQLQLWTCNGSINQQFQMSCSSANETKCRIAPHGTSFRKCLSVKGGSTANNAALIIWDCNSAKDQSFRFRKA
ncbi:RICIN domain-containing protein [Streptomyces syringium]|uniref:RICIN domain-containing protein n=1 Tax=Streptomyces syringium TaxID=76729 RepID=UPI0034064B87